MMFSPFFLIGTPLTCSIMKDLFSLFAATYKQPYKPITTNYVDWVFAGLCWLILMEVFEAGANRIILDPSGNVGARLRTRTRGEKYFPVEVEEGKWGRGTFKGAIIQTLTLRRSYSSSGGKVWRNFPSDWHFDNISICGDIIKHACCGSERISYSSQTPRLDVHQ